MKHTATELAKFKKLKRRLGLPKYAVIGLLEALWHATQRNSPRGDIGAKLDNEDIAIELDWEGDADDLIQALIDTKWLDESDEHRLVVHDWHEHAPRYIHGVVAKQKQEFAVASNQLQMPTVVDNCSSQLEQDIGGNCSKVQPNLTKPNLTNTPLPPTGGKFDPKKVQIPEPLDSPAFRDAWSAWCDHRKEIRKKLTEHSVKLQLDQLAKQGLPKAIETIYHTIEKGWTGLRPPDPKKDLQTTTVGDVDYFEQQRQARLKFQSERQRT